MSGRARSAVLGLLGRFGGISFAHFARVVAVASASEADFRAASDADLMQRARSALPGSPELLAALREVSRRTLGLRPFDEQLVGAAALAAGYVVEMDTGEGKTLVGAIAAASQVLAGRGVQLLSVNDYLAERDATWMRGLFEFLDISSAWIGQHTSHEDRRAAYSASIVYLPVSELGFDVLRDRFAVTDDDRVAPQFDVAIVDEADAVMIDEATLPLVLAGESETLAEGAVAAQALVDDLVEGTHFATDAERITVSLTDEGLDRLEDTLGGINLYSAENIGTLTLVNLALHARVLVQRDVDYLVRDGGIQLINVGRGRVAHLQRWPDGLHAAIETKEGLPVTGPGSILDTTTIQDLLTRFQLLSGMSGTVLTVAEELAEFYAVKSGRVERHAPNRRIDLPEQVVITAAEKQLAVIAAVASEHASGRPVLVGTQSVAESDELAGALVGAGITPTILNARNDATEAEVISHAGEYGAVTISTQMSGRGTDIRLGGPEGRDHSRVAALGGLAVISTGRHPSRRLDAQLGGRSGRQGDPGTALTITALDDDIVLSNAPAHLITEINRIGDGLSAQRRAKIVDSCQSIGEGHRRDQYRATWGYNRAITAQRAAVLDERQRIMDTGRGAEEVRGLQPAALSALETAAGRGPVGVICRQVALFFIDDQWQDHLALLGEVRDGIHLRALAGQTPVDEFHKIALVEFSGFFELAYGKAARFIAALDPADLAGSLDELGLRRPSATWTYMITDDPFGSPGDRFARALGKSWRRLMRLE